MRKKVETGELVLYGFLVVIITLYILPLYWMVSSSFKTTSEITQIPPTWWPHISSIDGYIKVWRPIFLQYFINTFIYAGGSTGIGLFTSSLIGFVIVIYPSRIGEILFWSAVCLIMVPFTLLIIPLYLMEIELGLVNTYIGMIAPRVVYPFGIFFMRQAMRNVPRALVDAAKIDGCSTFRIYWQIVLPLVKTNLAALAILEFVWRWNELMWPLIIATTEKMFPVSVGLAALVDPYFIELDQYLAASMIIIIPVFIIFLSLQKFFIKGVAISGMK